MATRVIEIMNPELFGVSPDERVDRVMHSILALGITAAPVLDGEGRPVGVASLRDLVAASRNDRVENHMTSPAAIVRHGASVAQAARLLAETGYRRLVVVDAQGKAAGMISAVDIVRGLIGLPAAHPPAFPHLDRTTGLAWTDDAVLSLDSLADAPDGPGLVVLTHGGAGIPERVVWVESSPNVRNRLTEMLSVPQRNWPDLQRWVETEGLRYRAAPVADPSELRSALEKLRTAKAAAASGAGGTGPRRA